MAKIFHKFDPARLREGLARIRDNLDVGERNMRPKFDPRERADQERQAADGKDLGGFTQVLERHGFRWYPPVVVARQAALAGTSMVVLPGEAAPAVEGQWRSRRWGWAFTPGDLVGGFAAPEDLDRHLRREALARRMQARRVGKGERRVALARA